MYSRYLRERIVRLSKTLSGKDLVDAIKEEGFKEAGVECTMYSKNITRMG